MDTIDFTQTRGTQDIYIYPNGDLSSCTNWLAYGAIPNYACVDEDKDSYDDDTTYVYWNTPSVVTDLYELPNQSDLGEINYVAVYARTKSHTLAQDSEGIFRIIISPNSVCSNLALGTDQQITTNYKNYQETWLQNPDDDEDWEWTDIDTLAIGVQASSPTYQSSEQIETLRPSGDDAVQLTPSDPLLANWEAVWFASGYNYPPTKGTTYKEDTYDLADHTTDGSGNITKVVVSAYVRSSAGQGKIKLTLDSNGTQEYGTEITVTNGYGWYSHEWALDPDTSAAWTWAAINALIAGITMKCNGETWTRVYRLTVDVYYTSNVNPEVHVTQCYAKVNYDSNAVECSLNRPKEISADHSRNVKMLNFWNGEREVYDLDRHSKTIVMTGEEFEIASVCSSGCPCNRIACMRDMANNGTKVALSGLYGMHGIFNGDYQIRSFGWKKISHKPIHFEWILELEADS